MPPIKNRTAVNCLLGLASFGLTLVAADTVLKIVLCVPSNYLKKIIRTDPNLQPPKRLKPDLDYRITGAYREFSFRLRTDGEGFRRSSNWEGTQKVENIFFLGDSQTVGVGVNDAATIPSLLASGAGRKVLNTGCFGYSTLEEIALYRSTVPKHPAGWIVLCFFAGNDPYENWKQKSVSEPAASGRARPPAFGSIFSSFKIFLKQRSSVYNLLDRFRKQDFFNKALGSLRVVTERFPDELLIFKKDGTAGSPHWAITEEALVSLAREAEARGSRFLLVLIPDRYQVDKTYWGQWVAKYHLNSADFDLSAPNKRLEAFCARSGIRFLDATPALRKAEESGQRVYWRIDSHLNATGNRLMADLIAERLRKEVTS